MDRKLLSLFGLKFNPFSQQVPVEALLATGPVSHFLWRVENLAREGGFAMVDGRPGEGKSAGLRLLQDHLAALVDVQVGEISRPHGGVADFYRELGDLFGVHLSPHNRWAGAKVLRNAWLTHIEQSLFRPVLLIDEAQEMTPETLTELKLLSSACLDSKMLLTVVLAGDHRLKTKFGSEKLLPLGNRIQVRLHFQGATAEDLLSCLQHRIKTAGNPKLITPDLQRTLCEHAAGNYRTLMNTAGELLAAGVKHEARQLDEQLFLEIFTVPPPKRSKATSGKRARR